MLPGTAPECEIKIKEFEHDIGKEALQEQRNPILKYGEFDPEILEIKFLIQRSILVPCEQFTFLKKPLAS